MALIKIIKTKNDELLNVVNIADIKLRKNPGASDVTIIATDLKGKVHEIDKYANTSVGNSSANDSLAKLTKWLEQNNSSVFKFNDDNISIEDSDVGKSHDFIKMIRTEDGELLNVANIIAIKFRKSVTAPEITVIVEDILGRNRPIGVYNVSKNTESHKSLIEEFIKWFENRTDKYFSAAKNASNTIINAI